MLRITEVLQPLLQGHTNSVDTRELLAGIQSFSEYDRKNFERLLATWVPREHLLLFLKNRRPPLNISEAIASKTLSEQVVTETPRKSRRQPAHITQRTAYVLNPYPEYQLPIWIGKTPPINQSLVEAYHKKPLPKAFWDRLHALRKVQGKRLGIPCHRIRTIESIVPCLTGSMNVSSLQCFVCVKSIAAQCGLTVSRVSRALSDLANAGLLSKKLKRTLQGRYQAVTITLTRKTLKILGVSDERLKHAQKMHKKLSAAANQALVSAKRAMDSVAESLATFKKAIQQQVTKSFPNSPNKAKLLAKKVEETLREFGLEGDNLSTG